MQVERSEIEAEIATTLAEVLQIDPGSLSPDTRLSDLGMTSLDFVEAVYMVEQKFKVTIPFNVNDRGAPMGEGTVADVLRKLTEQVSACLAVAGTS